VSVETICLYQFNRPSYSFKREGVGDCRKCISTPENVNCKNYYPIKVYTLREVKIDE